MTTIEFFWDVGSPYTYLAATQLAGLRERTGADIRYRPFLLGGVFKAVGNTVGPSSLIKGAHMRTDLARWRNRYGVPMRLPPDEVVFPINSVLPMRVAVAAEEQGIGDRYCHLVLSGYWADGLDVSGEAVLRPLLEGAGFDADMLFMAAAEQEVKDKLRTNGDEAVRRGAFGAPTFFVGEEMFWGNDRLDFVEEAVRRSA